MLFCKKFTRSSPTILFFHGLFGSSNDGALLAKTSSFSWELYDLPGHGKTKQNGCLAELETLMPNSPFHLVGYSLGGRLAQKLAHHKNALSLTLISSHTLFTAEELIARQRQESDLEKKLGEQAFELFIDNWYNQSLFSPLKQKKTLFEAIKKRRLNQNKEDLLFGLSELSINKIESKIPSCPILALYGNLDAKYRKLYRTLPSCIQVVSVDNAGHTVHLENPKETLRLIETFIRSLQ